jgi:hypothetical protein
LAKDKLFSTSNKQRTKQPNQVLRTANIGKSSLQTQYDQQPYATSDTGIPKRPALPKTGSAPFRIPSQRPKHVAVSPKNARWQRKGGRPSAYSGLQGRFRQAKKALGY